MSNPPLRLRVHRVHGEYAKTNECTADGISNMPELLARLNSEHFIALTMEDDLGPTLVSARFIVAVEEIGARLDGM